MASDDPAGHPVLASIYKTLDSAHQTIKSAHPATLAALATSAAVASAAYIMTRDKYSLMEKPADSKIDLNNQSVVIGGKVLSPALLKLRLIYHCRQINLSL